MIPARTSIPKKKLLLIFVDLIIVATVPILSVYLYFLIKLGFDFRLDFLKIDRVFYVSNILFFMTIFYVMGFYDFRKNFATKREIFTTFLTLSAVWIFAVFFFYLCGKPPIGRGISFIYMSVLFFLIAGYRAAYSKLAVIGLYNRKAIIVGAGEGGQAIASLIRGGTDMNVDISPVCMLDIEKEKEGQTIHGVPVVCQHGSLTDAVEQYRPDLLIMAMRSSRYEKLIKELILCSQQGIEIRDMTSIYEELAGKIPLKYVSDHWLLFSHMNQPRFYLKQIKRKLDLIFSTTLLAFASPVMLLTALAIKLDSKGPVFYRQLRVGKDGREFELIKFRSMIENAERGMGAVWVGERDPRITRVGKILRFLRVDELPQFFNVFRGEMNIVGPRPERPEFVADFLGKTNNRDAIIPFYNERLTVKPGITGWAQVMYPYAASHEESLKKLEYDLYYIKNVSFFRDITIILRTIRVVLFCRGAK